MSAIVLFVFSVFIKMFGLFPINKRKVICTNFYGKSFGDNPKYIALELLKRNNYDIYWVVKNKGVFVPNGIRKVKKYSPFYFYHIATSKIWISNVRLPYFVSKRKGQFYIQTWHGSIGLKKCEFDSPQSLSPYYLKCIENDNKMIDLMLSNSDFADNLYRNALKYSGKISECGCPRSDIFFSKIDSQKIKDSIRLGDKKILLYAPTFRNDYSNMRPYDVDFEKLVKILKNKTNAEWVVLFKFHPNMSSLNMIDSVGSIHYRNVSNYPDIQELIFISDIIITDYSSLMIDSLIADKPVFLYANDIDSYVDERGFYFKFQELPFPLAKNNKELQSLIEKTNFEDVKSKYSEFKKKVQLRESGNASEKVSNMIDKICK